MEYVFRGAPPALQALQQSLAGRGYKLLTFTPEERRLEMAKSFPLHPGPIFAESIAHQDECERLGIEFDGWGCLAVK